MSNIGKSDPVAGEPVKSRLPDPATAAPRLSIADAARALDVSSATVRRYMTDHGDTIETVRDGRSSMILLSSFPVLARIRDLRRHRVGKEEIDRLLRLPDGEALRIVHTGSVADSPANPVTDATLMDLRKEFGQLKQELRDNELVVRQSLSTILFLIEKHSREVEFHASEERIANRERDLRLTQQDRESRVSGKQHRRRKGVFAALASMILSPISSSR